MHNYKCMLYFRIQGIVGKTCIMTWARKLFSQFVNYIRDIFDNITKECDEKRSIVQGKLYYVLVIYRVRGPSALTGYNPSTRYINILCHTTNYSNVF